MIEDHVHLVRYFAEIYFLNKNIIYMNQEQYEFYTQYYKDLNFMNKEEAQVHYNLYGQKEGRIITFDTEFYKKFYNVYGEDAWIHYKRVGEDKNYKLMDNTFYKEDLTLQEIMNRRNIKFEKIKTLLKDNPQYIDEEGKYFYISESDTQKFGVHNTENVSSNSYDELTDALSKEEDKIIVDVGSGKRHKYYKNVVNVEIVDYHTTDIICVNEKLPFKDNSVDYILSLCVLEHVKYPWISAGELKRILKPGGKLIINVPFLQPYHGYPGHYFNATKDGIRVLMEGLKEESLFCPIYNHPMYTLKWFLGNWIDGLSNEDKEKFKKLTIGDIVNKSAEEQMKEGYAKLPDKTQDIIACGFAGTFVKP